MPASQPWASAARAVRRLTVAISAIAASHDSHQKADERKGTAISPPAASEPTADNKRRSNRRGGGESSV